MDRGVGRTVVIAAVTLGLTAAAVFFSRPAGE
jgi:hypothetical protein